MTNSSNRKSGLSRHGNALVAAVVAGGLISLVTLVVAMFVDLSTTATNVIYVAGIFVVLLLLIRWFLLYKTEPGQ
jgi:hypothetical protein